MARNALVTRTTGETDIKISLNLDGKGQSKVDTGIGFFDHMLNSFVRHGMFDADIKAKGDLETILLDEPTIHLDSFRRHELINLLKDMTVLPQMIIVTHESQLENAADNLVKVEKNNGISKVSN